MAAQAMLATSGGRSNASAMNERSGRSMEGFRIGQTEVSIWISGRNMPSPLAIAS
jgi:hypothetical protein